MQGELWICKCMAAPHWSNENEGATTDGAGLCVCVRDGGRGARRQSLGMEPGMPSLQAKQEHGEPSGERSLATTAVAATAVAESAAHSALLRDRTLGQRSYSARSEKYLICHSVRQVFKFTTLESTMQTKQKPQQKAKDQVSQYCLSNCVRV